jgi:hypothetical protein
MLPVSTKLIPIGWPNTPPMIVNRTRSPTMVMMRRHSAEINVTIGYQASARDGAVSIVKAIMSTGDRSFVCAERDARKKACPWDRHWPRESGSRPQSAAIAS